MYKRNEGDHEPTLPFWRIAGVDGTQQNGERIMSLNGDKLIALRKAINENLRIQQGGAKPIPYIDVSNALGDICARQNHTVFGRRGCGEDSPPAPLIALGR